MLNRVIFSLREAANHRSALCRIASSGHGESLPDVTSAGFPENIKVIALDFDGVLGPHGYPRPTVDLEQWFAKVRACGQISRVYIYSNKPTQARKHYFETYLPEICFLSGIRKKPFPDGIKRIAELEGVPPEAVLMVDDRLLTGMLAAILAGAQGFYVTRPVTDFGYRPVHEAVFGLLRVVEKLMVRMWDSV
jgi:uncharacterized protein